MGRKRITEFAAKKILFGALGKKYHGLSITQPFSLDILDSLSGEIFVVKVDQGVKKRFKQGLVLLNKTKQELPAAIKELFDRGYSQVLIEPYVDHKPEEEKYLALEQIREGVKVYYSKKGGIDIESHSNELQSEILGKDSDIQKVADYLKCSQEIVKQIVSAFKTNYISFLEINPLVVSSDTYLLDVACEVDSAAEFFVNGQWSERDFAKVSTVSKTPEEKAIELLASKSQASFKFDVLNKNGSIFVLLSGGGASVVVADEVYNQGYHKELANYGEYSGNPNAEETYLYTKSLLSLLLKSKNPKKVLIIGGGVANFTDIRITFKGVIKALDEVAQDLKKEKVKVFVRRGGPNQKEGLEMISSFLKEKDLFGQVSGPEMVLTDIVLLALSYLKG